MENIGRAPTKCQPPCESGEKWTERNLKVCKEGLIEVTQGDQTGFDNPLIHLRL